MKRMLICFISVAIFFTLVTGQCFADYEASFQKLIVSAKGIGNDNIPQVALTHNEENEIINAFIDHQKAQGNTLTKQQATMIIGQIAGYTAAALNMAEAFSGSTAQTKPEQPKGQLIPQPPTHQLNYYDNVEAKLSEAREGKIGEDEFMEYLGFIANDKTNDSKERAYALAIRSISYLYSNKGDGMQKAQVDANDALAIDNSIPVVYKAQAQILFMQKKYNEASEFYLKASELSANEISKSQNLQLGLQAQAIAQAIARPFTVIDFFNECSINPFAAEEKYKNSYVAISGKVSKITRSMDKLPVIEMEAASFKEVHFELFENQMPNISQIKPGEEVLIVGRLKEARDSITLVNDCILVR